MLSFKRNGEINHTLLTVKVLRRVDPVVPGSRCEEEYTVDLDVRERDTDRERERFH